MSMSISQYIRELGRGQDGARSLSRVHRVPAPIAKQVEHILHLISQIPEPQPMTEAL